MVFGFTQTKKDPRLPHLDENFKDKYRRETQLKVQNQLTEEFE